ncbi:SDR family oxidoreductase [Streptomyces sp. NBC_00557]|uniref:SDR family oxidoreductase n=1 Tax=Streptomyces sp. NBC_00557 TaxID=2975776 RepID=UPI002E80BCF7|nr:NAD(P)H-binding protein [Streptomyces sp. NBC_00557]WUC37676.1 NAD(P)H-binding protein [Streptomyces sp. NBC_00557]
MLAVTGATGSVGRALVGRLLAAGRPVRALTRDPQRAALPDGAEVVRSGPTAPPPRSTRPALFRYAQTCTPGLLKAARAQGVRHVVLLSSGLIKEGAAPNTFATNALQWAPQIRAGNTVHAVFAHARSAPIHEDDIAAVAERAPLDGGHEAAIHRLTGPEALTHAGQAAAIGAALGRRLTFVETDCRQAGPGAVPATSRPACSSARCAPSRRPPASHRRSPAPWNS